MKRNRAFAFILVIVLMLFTACSKTVTDINQYEQCYNKYFGKISAGLFPKKIPDNASNVKFIFENTEDLLFSEYQVYLEYTLGEDDYIKAVDDISKIKGEVNEIKYNKDDYCCDAYVGSDLRKNKNETFYSDNEYILADSKNFRIIYIFLLDKEKNEIKFPKEYLPKNIDEKQKTFSINMEEYISERSERSYLLRRRLYRRYLLQRL